MQIGEVFEISFHPIDGKHGSVDRGGRLSTRGLPVNEFSCKTHTDLRSCLTEECKCSLTEEDVDAKP
jgi:hypothetical protein